MNPKDPGLWAYFHPLLAVVVLVLCFFELRIGLVQRTQRTRRVAAPAGNLKRHLQLGPWAVGLFLATAVGGLASTAVLRDWALLSTWHGRLGLVAVLCFLGVGWLGRRVRGGEKGLANVHGVVATLGLFLGAIVAMLGFDLLP